MGSRDEGLGTRLACVGMSLCRHVWACVGMSLCGHVIVWACVGSECKRNVQNSWVIISILAHKRPSCAWLTINELHLWPRCCVQSPTAYSEDTFQLTPAVLGWPGMQLCCTVLPVNWSTACSYMRVTECGYEQLYPLKVCIRYSCACCWHATGLGTFCLLLFYLLSGFLCRFAYLVKSGLVATAQKCA